MTVKRRGTPAGGGPEVEAVLAALRAGLISELTAERLLWEQLAAVCPTCRDRLAAALEKASETSRMEQWLLAQEAPGTEEQSRARAELQRLLRLDGLEAQLETLDRATVRFRQPLTAALLLDEAFDSFHDDPDYAADLAHLAQVVAYRAGHVELEAVAWGYRGNARRAQGQLTEADPLFARARFLLRGPYRGAAPGRGVFVVAELDSLEGTLRVDQRRFEEAAALLHSARSLYKRVGSGSTNDEARVLLQLGSLSYCAGDPEAASARGLEAVRLIKPFQAPRLHLWAHHNLALYLKECGQPAAAGDLLALLRPLYRATPGAPQLRLEWLEGRIALALGEWSEARHRLHSAAERFLGLQQYLFAGFVCLDLADLYIANGQSAEIKTVTACLPVIFRSQRLSRESMSALVLFYRAVQADGLSRELVARVRQQLMAAQAIQ